MRTLLGVSAVVIAVTINAFVFAPEREITTDIVIGAKPGRVWSVLTYGANYNSWNPFIVSMKGLVAEGSTLENTMEPAKGKQMTFRPTVLAAEENREFRWLGYFLLPGIFDGEHYFLLEALGGETRLIHGEKTVQAEIADPHHPNRTKCSVAYQARPCDPFLMAGLWHCEDSGSRVGLTNCK